jgi:hypothetical protein
MGDELRALRRLQREQEPIAGRFTSERGGPFTTAGLARMVERAGINGADKSEFIFQICVSGAAFQARHPATIKLTHYPRPTQITSSNLRLIGSGCPAGPLPSVNHLDDLPLTGIDQHNLVANREIPVLAQFGIVARQFLRHRLQLQAA